MGNKVSELNVQSQIKLSLGPLLFFWPQEKVRQFYEQVAVMPLHTVYLGEVVCARRHEIRSQDWLDLGKDLASAGKVVVLSSQVLLESEVDLRRLRKFVEQGIFQLEANDLGAVKLASERRLPFVAGQTLNIYNEETLKMFQDLGAVRWVPPAELSAEKLRKVLESSPQMPCEVFAWGMMPLAFSARCFTARHYNLKKDACDFKCREHPDAMLLKTREGKPFLTMNGIQIMSAGCQALIGHLPQMIEMGVDMLRLSPQSMHMAQIVQLHADVLQSKITAAQAIEQLRELAPPGGQLVDGYWRGEPGVTDVEARGL